MGQIADESDRVREQHFAARGQDDVADGWIEGREHTRIGQNLGAGKPIEQSGFA